MLRTKRGKADLQTGFDDRNFFKKPSWLLPTSVGRAEVEGGPHLQAQKTLSSGHCPLPYVGRAFVSDTKRGNSPHDPGRGC